jgi:thiol-disulfide isomerase/thioredoxin
MTDVPAFVSPPSVPTDAEESVRAILTDPGVHVVHFWAPWCGNSIDELPAWRALLSENRPDATFAFVTVWDNGLSGREQMDDNGISSDVVEITQADRGPSSIKELRRKEFLGLPMTWIPSTWIFRGDTVAYAINYGEASEATLRALIADAERGW